MQRGQARAAGERQGAGAATAHLHGVVRAERDEFRASTTHRHRAGRAGVARDVEIVEEVGGDLRAAAAQHVERADATALRADDEAGVGVGIGGQSEEEGTVLQRQRAGAEIADDDARAGLPVGVVDQHRAGLAGARADHHLATGQARVR